jgi:hypothetical protein
MNNKYVFEVRAQGGQVVATYVTKDDAEKRASMIAGAHVMPVATGL